LGAQENSIQALQQDLSSSQARIAALEREIEISKGEADQNYQRNLDLGNQNDLKIDDLEAYGRRYNIEIHGV